MAPPLNIRCEARLNIVRAFEQIGLELFAEPGDGILVWARFQSGGIGRLVIDIPNDRTWRAAWGLTPVPVRER
jgi:hypothetical protein